MFFFAAILLGFLGSFHCIGMCGPIALSIPVKAGSSFNAFLSSLVYNSGRIITYAVFGLFFGLLGQSFKIAGLQNIASILLGSTILFFLIIPRFSILKVNNGILFQWLEKVKSQMRRLFGIYSMKSLLLIGILNGLLPCGLVYLAVAGSVSTGSPLKGAIFMAGFGLGTFPAMMTISLLKDYISLRFRQRIRLAVPMFAGMMAIMLILRGMNLGIPYLSPSIEKSTGTYSQECCNK